MSEARSVVGPGTESGQFSLELPIFGMHCEGCAATVRLGLGLVEGVTRVEVDLKGKKAVVLGREGVLNEATLHAAVEELGFGLTPPKLSESPGHLRERSALWKLVLLAGALAGTALFGSLLFKAWTGSYLAMGTFERLITAFSQISLISIGLAFLLGLVVAFAPSTYAMAPAVMGYVSGARVGSARQAAALSASFVGGIVLIDMLVGGAFALGGAMALEFFNSRLPFWFAIITLALVALALVNLGVWRPRLPSFVPRMRYTRSRGGAFLLGIPFGLMACPACTPLLLPVALGAAATGQAWYGAALLGAFALGRGIPLTVLGTSIGAFQALKGATRLVPWVEKGVGVLLLLGALWFFREFLLMGGFGALFGAEPMGAM